MPTSRYSTPLAFRTALDDRLRKDVGPARLGRRQQLLIFDRFLARLGVAFGESMVVKGGVALELRLARARTTKDVDIRLVGSSEQLTERLQAAGRLDLSDWMSFDVSVDEQHPDIDNEGVRYEGQRFRVVCRIGGQPYANRFGLDVAFADPMLGSPVIVAGDRALEFVDVPPVAHNTYPPETHLAEKLHAYTLPRKRVNSRVKDLPDIGLLGLAGALQASDLRQALELTFRFRGTHDIPPSLPPPPVEWAKPYAVLARANDLPWPDLDSLAVSAASFLDPLLRGDGGATWDPAGWGWK